MEDKTKEALEMFNSTIMEQRISEDESLYFIGRTQVRFTHIESIREALTTKQAVDVDKLQKECIEYGKEQFTAMFDNPNIAVCRLSVYLAIDYLSQQGLLNGGWQPIEEAFLAGFKISGEGWNGEYPHEGENDSVIWEDIKESFEDYLKPPKEEV